MPRAIVLFSGGLDSILAVRILQEQRFDIDALCINTFYSSCRSAAEKAAAELGIKLTVLPVGEDYVEVIRNPLYGYGKGANPCVDCRIYMCRMAQRLMRELGACMVVTGEVVGQRPMSQKRQHLEMIARRSGLEGRLLRPLSAKLLPPTVPEQEMLVDRRRLYDFNGRGRRGLIALAESLGISTIPTPSSGCTLTEPSFAGRVRDLLQFCPDAVRWDFELLSHGRHFRFDEQTKVVIARSATDNDALRSMAAAYGVPLLRQKQCCENCRENTASDEAVAHCFKTSLVGKQCGAEILTPLGFRGPGAVVVGRIGEQTLAFAGALILRYAGTGEPDEAEVRVGDSETGWGIKATRDTAAESATPL